MSLPTYGYGPDPNNLPIYGFGASTSSSSSSRSSSSSSRSSSSSSLSSSSSSSSSSRSSSSSSSSSSRSSSSSSSSVRSSSSSSRSSSSSSFSALPPSRIRTVRVDVPPSEILVRIPTLVARAELADTPVSVRAAALPVVKTILVEIDDLPVNVMVRSSLVSEDE